MILPVLTDCKTFMNEGEKKKGKEVDIEEIVPSKELSWSLGMTQGHSWSSMGNVEKKTDQLEEYPFIEKYEMPQGSIGGRRDIGWY